MAKLNASVFADEEIAIEQSSAPEPVSTIPDIDNSDWVDVDDDIFAIDEPKQPTSEPTDDEPVEQIVVDRSADHSPIEQPSDDAAIVAVDEHSIVVPQSTSFSEGTFPEGTSVIADGVLSIPAGYQNGIPEPEWDEATEHRKDELAFFERLKELNVAIEHAKEAFNEAKEEAKLAKDTLSVAVAQLQNFASKGVQYRKKPVPKIVADRSADHPPLSSPTTSPTNSPDETEWRSWETATILDGIEGLGTKKRELLIEHFPTFGKLMDAREEAGKEFVSFHSLLPKGIGETIGTEIINRMDAKIVPGM